MFAFTLAEVLITLVIIGVIAAITIPSLINKTNNQETVSRLKKAYSTLAQATNLIIAEEGPANNWITTIDNVYNLYKKHLNNAKECSASTGCFSQLVDGGYYALNNERDTNNWNENTGFRKLVLADGVQVMFTDIRQPLCVNENLYNMGSSDVCERIFVDINGEKKPNVYGRDLFVFVIKKNGLYPAGCDVDGLCNKNEFGTACACKVLREGAMNY